MGGIAEIDVDDWKKHTDYRGYTENDEVVQWFWKVRGWMALLLTMFQYMTVSNLYLNSSSIVRQVLGWRKEISSFAIYNWHIAYPSQWIQGSPG